MIKSFLVPLLLGLISCTISASASTAAETKLQALVIGNGEYSVGELKNPTHDARLMEKSLRDLGFQVTLKTNLGHQQMEESISKFCRTVPKGSLAFFFFAGHGVQVKGENYLIPVDAEIHDESAVKYKTVSQSYIFDALDASGSNMNVLVLDCCRDNPFERSWARGIESRGLAKPAEIPEGTIFAYATTKGKTALDGKGENSPYTLELAAALAEHPPQGLLLRDVFFNASRQVRIKTGQRPWVNVDASYDRFYLRPPKLSDSESAAAKQMSSLKPEKKLPPMPASTEPKSPPKQEPRDDDTVLRLASAHLDKGRYSEAIDAYTTIIESVELPSELRAEARKGRGAALLSRRFGDDINRAIVDLKSAGEPGALLSVATSMTTLKVGSQTSGNVYRNQVVLLSESNGDWLWVKSIQGDETRNGWITKDAFVVTASKPANPGVVDARAKVPASSRPVGGQASQPVPGQATVYDKNGQPIYGSNRTQSMTYDQYGRPIVRQSPTGYDQHGRPINQTGSTISRQQNYAQPGQQNRQSAPSGGDNFTRDYMRKHGRAPSIWETPRWESPAEIRRLRAQGLVR